jgi:uncharacterized membrane protein HdeD (DUF308 family)
MATSKNLAQKAKSNAPFWVTLVRAVLATLLGLALLIQPDKARPMLVNFMGMFWLASGIMSVRWSATGKPEKRIWPILAGIVGVIAGILALTRNLATGYLSDVLVLNILGAVMFLTGILHVTGGFRIGQEERHRTWASVLLGVFEMILGAIAFMAQSLELSSAIYVTLIIWALLGGFILFVDAFALRRRARQESGLDDTYD